jgi:hypothetical protein
MITEELIAAAQMLNVTLKRLAKKIERASEEKIFEEELDYNDFLFYFNQYFIEDLIADFIYDLGYKNKIKFKDGIVNITIFFS